MKIFYTALTSVLIAFTYAFLNPVHPVNTTGIVPNVQADSLLDSDSILSLINSYDSNNSDTVHPVIVSAPVQDTRVAIIPEDTHPKAPRQTRGESEHVLQGNGSMYAQDWVYADGNVPFPDTYGDFYIYYIGKDERLGDYIILRHGETRYVIGHTVTSRKQGDAINTKTDGYVLGQSNLSGLTDGLHAHIERWTCPKQDSRMSECSNVSSTGEIAPRNEALKEQRSWVKEVTPQLPKAQSATKKDSKGQGVTPQLSSSSKATTDQIQVVACLNENDMSIHEPNKGTCYLGKGGRWKNIMLPPKKDIEMFKKIFGEDYKYRLAIANFEGSFNPDAGNEYAKGYLQTLRSYNIPNDAESQLNWLAKREIGTTGRICDLNGWNKDKMERYACMATGHFGFFKPGDKHYAHSVMYKKRYKAATEYYLTLNF